MPARLCTEQLWGLGDNRIDVINEGPAHECKQAATWASLLASFHAQYARYLKERTFATDDPQQAASKGIRLTSWWYTHERDRRVYQRLNRLSQAGELFSFLTTTAPLHSTTNPVESINHQVKQVIKHHPGLSQDHLTCAIEWTLHAFTETPNSPGDILKAWMANGQPTRTLIPKKPKARQRIGPKQYDTAFNPEERL